MALRVLNNFSFKLCNLTIQNCQVQRVLINAHTTVESRLSDTRFEAFCRALKWHVVAENPQALVENPLVLESHAITPMVLALSASHFDSGTKQNNFVLNFAKQSSFTRPFLLFS